MKKTAKFIIVCMLAFFINSCEFFSSTDDKNNSQNKDPAGSSRQFSKEFWGEWIRMDTGDEWYISSNSIKVNSRAFPTDAELVKQSDRVIEVNDGSRKYFLFASRAANSSFSGRVASVGASDNRSIARAIGAGLGGMNVTISNLNNKTKTTSATTDSNGGFTVQDAIAGDEYEIKTGDQATIVLPNANGDNIGTISVTSGVNFKTIIRPAEKATDMNRLYANLNSYVFSIEIENTGTVDCTAAVYSLELDNDLILNSGLKTGILGTIEPQKKKIIGLSISCGAIQDEYEFKRIGITIDDPIGKKSWDDSVSLKFNKAPVNFIMRSSSPVSGIIITPNAKAYSFKTGDYSGRVYSASLTMPWSTKDYLVVFSGATADTEAVYSLGINVIPDTNFDNFIDLGNYEPNDTENQATPVYMRDKIISYLHKNDIDYFKINLGANAPEIKAVTIADYAIKESSGNDDSKANPNETHYLDIRVKNNTNTTINISSVSLSTTSDYVTIDNGTATIGNMNTGYYTTLTDSSASSSATYAYLLYSSYLSKAFQFTIAGDCPAGTDIPFTVTFSDSSGNTWTDTLTIPIVATGATIIINTPVTSNFSIKEAANGNDDGKANPYETHYLDIRVKNSGNSNALGLQAVLSTTSAYVTIDNETAIIGDLTKGYYTTLTDSASSSATYTYLLSYSKYLTQAFKFTIAGDCPVGTDIPFTVTFTDSWGNIWTDSLTVPVVATGAAIIINKPVTSNFSIKEAETFKETGNGDGKANPHETHNLDIRVKNSGTSKVLGLQAALSTTSAYVMIDNGTTTIGDLNAGYYKTLTDSASSSATSTYLLSSSVATLAKAFKFTIADDCPVGTDIPFTVTFTDSWGNIWTDTLIVPVVATGANIAINTPVTDNFSIKATTSNLNLNQAKPNGIYYLDVRIKNSGTSNVLGLQAALSTTNSYITIDNGTATIGNLNKERYTTLTDIANSTSASSAFLLYSNYQKAFKFAIADDCPVGTELLFTVTFTDSWGNTWVDTLTIVVL